MKIKLSFFAAAAAVALLSACSQGAAPGAPVDTGTPGGGDGGGGGGDALFEDFAPSLFADDSITYGRWEQIDGGLRSNVAIGDWEASANLENADSGGIKASVVINKGWSAGTLAQVPQSAAAGSYIDFTDVAKIRFKFRSDNCTPAELKFKLASLTNEAAIPESALTNFSVSAADAEGWRTVTVPTKSLSIPDKKIKVAFTFVLPYIDGRWAEYKDIAFLNDSDANVTTLFDHVTF